ncbi:MAG: hypothetical protein MZU95_16640 [Desulfomicrobium escambiense]|nr:hypothetical protein [Desulfomicrobium escambiense]
MELVKVTDRKTEKMFLDTARVIYKNDRVWVCPFDNDIKAIFDPGKNPYYKHGAADRWVLTDGRKRLIGQDSGIHRFQSGRYV